MSTRLSIPSSLLLTLLFALDMSGLAGCGDRTFVHEEWDAYRVDETASVVGDPQWFAVWGSRTESTCAAITPTLERSCTDELASAIPVTAIDVRCPDGGCAVRPVAASEVPATVLARRWRDGSRDGVAFYEVTPLAPEATVVVDATLRGKRSTRQQRIVASAPVALDISAWAEGLRPALQGAALALVPTGSLSLGEPLVLLRRADAGGDEEPRPLGASQLAVEVEGSAVAARVVESPSPRHWLRVDAVSPGEATIVVRRRDLSARFTLLVASPDDVVSMRLHGSRVTDGFDPLPLAEVRSAEVVPVWCILGLKSGARALGGCGTLEPNAASGFERLDGVPVGAFAINLQRVAMPQPGGAISGRIGNAELLLPVVE